MDTVTISGSSLTIENSLKNKGRLNVYYHFYYPDDVVSAEHIKDLCEGLAERGWQVTVFTSNRYCRNPGQITPKTEIVNGVTIKRSWRPAFRQSTNTGRLANGFFIGIAWLYNTIRSTKPDFYIVGTDPQFSQFLFPFLKIISPNTKIVHWCFDLYPEAVIASTNNKLLIKLCELSKPVFKMLYQFVDIMIDVGSCMRNRLDDYQHKALRQTLVPWALVEPQTKLEVNPDVRRNLFGDSKLVLLYSGNLGQAHEYSYFLKLARSVRERNTKILFAFSSSGNKFNEFKSKVTEQDINIKFLPFAKIEELQDRLVAADIHLISLKKKWSGIVVPSKFFGSLAMSRPLLFHGPENSAINHWIKEFDVGEILTETNLEDTAEKLIHFAESRQLPEQWRDNAYQAYHNHFSKKIILDKWDELLLQAKTEA